MLMTSWSPMFWADRFPKDSPRKHKQISKIICVFYYSLSGVFKILKKVKLICGRSNRRFAKQVSEYVKVPLADVKVKKFSDGEIYFRVNESVRGADVYIIEPASDNVNEDVMELMSLMRQIHVKFSSYYTQVLSKHKFTIQHFTMMLLLIQEGNLKMKTIAKRLGVTNPAVTNF